MVKRRSTCSTSANQSSTSRHGVISDLLAATAERTAPEAEYICPAAFLRGWPVGVELVADYLRDRQSAETPSASI